MNNYYYKLLLLIGLIAAYYSCSWAQSNTESFLKKMGEDAESAKLLQQEREVLEGQLPSSLPYRGGQVEPEPIKKDSTVNPKAKVTQVGDALLIGPRFLEGWAVVPLSGYKFKDLGIKGPSVQKLGDGQFHEFVSTPYLLLPQQGRVLINPNLLPTVNQFIAEQKKVLAKLRESLPAPTELTLPDQFIESGK